MTPETSTHTTLLVLIEAGEAVLATKAMPPARLHGDWQVMETTYSVVEREPFMAWRREVLTWLESTYGVENKTYWNFFESCRVPNFIAVTEGVGLLRKLLKMPNEDRVC